MERFASRYILAVFAFGLLQGIIALKPEMYPAQEEILIQEGEVLEVKCKGEGKLQFSTERNLAWVNQSEFDISFDNNSGWYTFTRSNAIKEDTGWYACAEEGIRILNDETISDHPATNISWIYVYVNSSSAFAIDTYDCDDHYANLPVLWPPESDVVIPCRPTSPDLPVMGELHCSDKKSHNLPENTRYDPKIGFMLNSQDCLSIAEHLWRENGCRFKCQINKTDGITHAASDVPAYRVFAFEQHPSIENSLAGAPAIVGENLTLTCSFFEFVFGEAVSAYWKIPESVPIGRLEYNEARVPPGKDMSERIQNRNWRVCRFQLTIYNVQKADAGVYTWTIANSQPGDRFKSATIRVSVLQHGDVEVAPSAYVYAGQSADISCDVTLHDLDHYEWVKIGNSESEDSIIPPTSFGRFRTGKIRIELEFDEVSRSDNGTYECRATDKSGSIFRNRTDVIVFEPPEVKLNLAKSGGADSIYLEWTIYGNRVPVNTYSVERTDEEDFESMRCSRRIDGEISSYVATGLEKSTPYRFTVTAKDEIGTSQSAHSGWIWTLDEDIEFVPDIWINEAVGSPVTIEWSPVPSELKDHVHYYNVRVTHGTILEESTSVTPESNHYTFEKYESGIKYSIKIAACSNYTNKCGDWSNEIETIAIDQDSAFIPNITIGQSTSHSVQINWSMPQTELRERVHEYKLQATNTKDSEKQEGPFYVDETENSYVFRDLAPATYYNIGVAACSEYRTRCWDWASEEVVTLEADKVSEGGNLLMWIVISIIAILLFCMIVVWMIVLNRREMAARRRFIEASIELFKLGARGSVDPELAMADQAELLPYDKKWEYPRKLLKFDKVMGSGAFGIVKKAEAKSICKGQKYSTVAVKMVRATHRLDHMMALQRELKILAHLGKHVNIVNMLGACTNRISYGELLVIVEFCRFGNLHDYLLRRRTDFVDQVDVATGTIAGSSFRTDCVLAIDSSNTVDLDGNPETEECSQSRSADDASVTVDDPASGDDRVEPVQAYNYDGDFADLDLEPIGTRDLLCWAWQLSRGMNYLGSKRVVHADLATRNILLADNNTVKICDFGLAKSLYAGDIYKKEGTGPLPVKWMAIESIGDRLFSVKSDVWSFGVVLWELFTLAKTPYPGIANESIYTKLVDGFRMEKPQYATDGIYRMMLSCWEAEPLDRPSFRDLEDILDELLDDRIKDHYVNFDAEYARINAEELADGKKDYLTMSASEYASGAAKTTV